MSDETGVPDALPAVHAANVADVLAAHGEGWQIGQDGDTKVWTAVRRPSVSSMHVLVGHTLAELAVKLDAAGPAA